MQMWVRRWITRAVNRYEGRAGKTARGKLELLMFFFSCKYLGLSAPPKRELLGTLCFGAPDRGRNHLLDGLVEEGRPTMRSSELWWWNSSVIYSKTAIVLCL